jgi:hypothetical protein
MRGKKAKAIRKIVYGNTDQRVKEYEKGHEPQMMVATGEKNPLTSNMLFRSNPTVLLIGLRRKYKQMKAMVQVMGRKPTIFEAYKMLI